MCSELEFFETFEAIQWVIKKIELYLIHVMVKR